MDARTAGENSRAARSCFDSLKIGFYLETYLPGGVERMLLDLIAACQPQDEIIVYHNGDPRFTDFLKAQAAFPIRQVPIPIWQTYRLRTFLEPWPAFLRKPLVALMRSLEYLLFNVNVRRIRGTIMQTPPLEIMQAVTGGYPGPLSCLATCVAASQLKINKIFINVMSQPIHRKFPLLDRRLDAQTRRAVTAWLPNTQAAGQRLIETREMPKDRVEVLYAWTLQSQQSLPNRPSRKNPRVGTLSVLIPEKGILHLIQAAARLREHGASFELHIAGGGPDRDRLEKETERQKLTDLTHFAGHLSPDHVVEFMDSLDVFVFCSTIMTEGLPYVMLEAMSRKLPIVFTRVGGTAEMLTNEVSGLSVPPGDAEALARGVQKLLDDERLRDRLGSAAQKRWETLFSDTSAVPRLAALYGRHA